MKILFFFTGHTRLDMAIKIQSEILIEHVLKGDEIYIVVDFESNIVKSSFAHVSLKSNLYYIKAMFQNLLKYLRSRGGNIKILNYKHISHFDIGVFEDIEALKGFTYKGYNVGQCAASSIISKVRDHKLNTVTYSNDIKIEIQNSIDVLNTMIVYHQEFNPDLVYLFNGRLSINAPIVLYCGENKIHFKIFEFSFNYNKYHLLSNATPFSLEYAYNEMKALWEDPRVDFEEKLKVGKSFFENQRNGVSTVELSYIGMQKQDFDIDKLQGKEVITIFNSSIDEFASVPEWENYMYIYQNEIEAIVDICEHYASDSSKKFILRIHPNLKFINNTQNRELLQLSRLKNLIIIPAHSPIRSYSLLDRSDKIVTFGSTIGVEACYYEKPAIGLGQSYSKYIDVVYQPQTREELFSLLDNKTLKSKPSENALMYGYWFLTLGQPYKCYDKGEIREGDYKLTKEQKRKGMVLKLSDLGEYKRILKVFDPNKNILKKIKDPNFRKSLKREFLPWRIK